MLGVSVMTPLLRLDDAAVAIRVFHQYLFTHSDLCFQKPNFLQA